MLACAMILGGCVDSNEDVKVDASSVVEVRGKPHPAGSRRLTLDCGDGENASAVGTYGGVGASLSCSRGRASSTIVVPSGYAYSFRVGVESAFYAVDGVATGDAETFSHQFLGTTFTSTAP